MIGQKEGTWGPRENFSKQYDNNCKAINAKTYFCQSMNFGLLFINGCMQYLSYIQIIFNSNVQSD